MRENAKNRLYKASTRAEITFVPDEVRRDVDCPVINGQFILQNSINLGDILRHPSFERLRIAPSERYPPKKIVQEFLTIARRLVWMLEKKVRKRYDERRVGQQS